MALSPVNKLPGLHICIGLGFFLLGQAAKNALPPTVGSLPSIQLPCAFFSAVLIPLGSLLALRALIGRSTSQRGLLCWHLIGVIFLAVILSQYFYVFLVENKVLELQNTLPRLLPKLVENARSQPSEQKRMFEAQWAFRMFGVIIAYRLDNGDAVYFIPSEEDKAFQRTQERSDAKARAMFEFVKRLTAQFPYLFGLYAATYTATFIVGGIWLVLKLPKDSPPTST